jgi:hypothetical protein
LRSFRVIGDAFVDSVFRSRRIVPVARNDFGLRSIGLVFGGLRSNDSLGCRCWRGIHLQGRLRRDCFLVNRQPVAFAAGNHRIRECHVDYDCGFVFPGERSNHANASQAYHANSNNPDHAIDPDSPRDLAFLRNQPRIGLTRRADWRKRELSANCFRAEYDHASGVLSPHRDHDQLT